MRRQRNLLGPQGMGGMVGLWGASSLIRSIQYGTITSGAASATAAINSVDINNAFVIMGGRATNWSGGSGAQYNDIRMELTNATTVTAARNSTGGITFAASFVVVEFLPGLFRSIQAGSIAISSGVTNTATVTSVNTAKAILVWIGNQANSTVDDAGLSYLSLTNATTITATRYGTTGGGISTAGYVLAEMF